MNIKLILLITLFLPAHAHSEGWRQNAWLTLLVNNHLKIGTCYKLLYIDNDVDAFSTTCDIGRLNRNENIARRDYYAQKLRHPLLSDEEFLTLHFELQYVEQIADQLTLFPRIDAGLMIMAIAEGIINHDK